MAKYAYKILLKDLLEDGEKIKPSDKAKVTKLIGARAIELMKKDMDRYRSPVTGTPFKALKDKDYQKIKGTTKSNLKLSGSLQEGIEHSSTTQSATISINEDNSLKAENHLKTYQSGNEIAKAAESKTGVRQRKFFPTGNEKLRKGIMKELRAIVEGFVDNGDD